MTGNLDNINLLRRQQNVEWPEFSWEIDQGDPSTRCYQMFHPYISRLGYNNVRRSYSIICPQLGVWLEDQVCVNVEITVTGQRGWVDESTKELAADITIEPRVWFSKGRHIKWELKDLMWWLAKSGFGFPLNKSDAIRLSVYRPGNPDQPILATRSGESTAFESPDFAKHPEAWSVANVSGEMGSIVKTHDSVVDDFNEAVMTIGNLCFFNLLKEKNVLSWNVWFKEPELVDQQEWQNHAEKWRRSIDSDNGSPYVTDLDPRYYDGSRVHRAEELLHELFKIISKCVDSL
ncbi:hypothetical protein [Candidatus Entotheonella palauensis]|nr:hypothetical protein [Candidatus Entotheonella palauensis]